MGRGPALRRSSAPGFAALLAALALTSCVAKRSGPPSPDKVTVGHFGQYSFQASGVAQLPDGRLIVDEDETLHPLEVVDLFRTGDVHEYLPDAIAKAFDRVGVTKLNDLESITVDSRGHVYASTSQSVTRAGVAKADRQLVVRFDVSGDSLTHPHALHRLTAALGGLDSLIAAGIGKRTKMRQPPPGLNIEGSTWDPRTHHLLFGLRSPLDHGRALVVSMDNPDSVFEEGAAPRLSGPARIGLNGQGIRGMAYDPDVDGILVLAGASGESAYGHPALWLWSGAAREQPTHLKVPALAGLKPEGVTPVVIGAHHALVFVCDDGYLDTKYYKHEVSRNASVPSRYIVVPLSVLLSDNPSLKGTTPGG